MFKRFCVRAFTITEMLVVISIISFILILIVQFIVFYNHLRRGMEKISDISNEAELLSERIKSVLYEPIRFNNSKIVLQDNPDLVIKRIIENASQSTTISAIGFYGLQADQNFWVNEIFISNTKREYKMSKRIYPEYRKFRHQQTSFVILCIYAEIYSSLVVSKSSKPKKVPFGTFFFSIIN